MQRPSIVPVFHRERNINRNQYGVHHIKDGYIIKAVEDLVNHPGGIAGDNDAQEPHAFAP